MNNCRFLVWNINQNNTLEILEALQAWEQQYQYDVLVLLECTKPMAERVRDALKWRWLKQKKDGKNYLKVFTKNANVEIQSLGLEDLTEAMKLKIKADYIGNVVALDKDIINCLNKIRHIKLNVSERFTLDCFFVHFYSLINDQTPDLLPVLIHVLNVIRYDTITKTNDSKILWAGDFNLGQQGNEYYFNFDTNKYATIKQIPFIPTRKAFFATEHSGDALDKYFYNPVGLVSGDYSDLFYHHSNPNRYRLNYSFYFDIKNSTQQYFNLIDGVLIGKGLIPYFKDESYRFLDCYLHHNRRKYLYDDSQLRPNKNLYSDHFPFIFELDFSTL